MNKTLNLSMILLLTICMLICNVYGEIDGPWQFKLKLGNLYSAKDTTPTIRNAYYQLECIENVDGTGIKVWRSDEDGYDYRFSDPGDDLLPLDQFDIYAERNVFTPWYIDINDNWYYECTLKLYETSTTIGTNDRLWGYAVLDMDDLSSKDMETEKDLSFLNPNPDDPRDAGFDVMFGVKIWIEANSYPGPWKFTLKTNDLTNLIDTNYEELYFKLKCYPEEDSFSDDGSTKFVSYENGYCYNDDRTTSTSLCSKFNIDAKGSKFTGWNIASDLYFYGCNLYLAKTGSLKETKYAVAPLPLRIGYDISTDRELILYEIGDFSEETGKKFKLSIQLLAEIKPDEEEVVMVTREEL